MRDVYDVMGYLLDELQVLRKAAKQVAEGSER